MSLNNIINMIAPVNGTLESIKIVGDSTKRGATGTPTTTGIYIKRDGTVSGSVSGKTLTITLEGGSTQWEGALTNDGITPYFTPAQMMLVAGIKRYTDTMSNAYVEEDYYGK